jgi:hypothetical protein
MLDDDEFGARAGKDELGRLSGGVSEVVAAPRPTLLELNLSEGWRGRRIGSGHGDSISVRECRSVFSKITKAGLTIMSAIR